MCLIGIHTVIYITLQYRGCVHNILQHVLYKKICYAVVGLYLSQLPKSQCQNKGTVSFAQFINDIAVVGKKIIVSIYFNFVTVSI